MTSQRDLGKEEPRKQPRYTIQELVAQCDPDAPLDDETIEWLHAPSAGREIPM
jgi:antitoxin ChpS